MSQHGRMQIEVFDSFNKVVKRRIDNEMGLAIEIKYFPMDLVYPVR